MLFASATFLFLFLPIICFLHFVLKKEWHNFLLLMASLFFYAWGEPTYLAIMLITIFINYFGALAIEKWQNFKKFILFLCVTGNLSFLVYFKYANFLTANISSLFALDFEFLDVVMPIGISFYTFQAISYLVDVYRQETAAQKNIYNLSLFISFFPQLIAGSIVKYHDIYEQINQRSIDFDKVDYGIRRFILGLAKKVLIANTLGSIADQVFALDPSQATVTLLWFGAVCYAFQLYFDFSGYSDMAIGLASIFEFKLLENFNYPYISASITEFWRRWHISLSTWFKEYVYIPLGGNRVKPTRVYINLFLVFLCTGIWHGASWNFVVWGLWHGFFIIIERASQLHRINSPVLRGCMHIYTLVVVLIGWVFFRAENFEAATEYIMGMFALLEFNSLHSLANIENVNARLWSVLAVALVYSFPLFKNVFLHKSMKVLISSAQYVWLLALLMLSLSSIAASTYNPFIYFRF